MDSDDEQVDTDKLQGNHSCQHCRPRGLLVPNLDLIDQFKRHQLPSDEGVFVEHLYSNSHRIRISSEHDALHAMHLVPDRHDPTDQFNAGVDETSVSGPHGLGSLYSDTKPDEEQLDEET